MCYISHYRPVRVPSYDGRITQQAVTTKSMVHKHILGRVCGFGVQRGLFLTINSQGQGSHTALSGNVRNRLYLYIQLNRRYIFGQRLPGKVVPGSNQNRIERWFINRQYEYGGYVVLRSNVVSDYHDRGERPTLSGNVPDRLSSYLYLNRHYISGRKWYVPGSNQNQTYGSQTYIRGDVCRSTVGSNVGPDYSRSGGNIVLSGNERNSLSSFLCLNLPYIFGQKSDRLSSEFMVEPSLYCRTKEWPFIFIFHPFRTPVPFWGQITWNWNGLPPNRDCGSKGVKLERSNYWDKTVVAIRTFFFFINILQLQRDTIHGQNIRKPLVFILLPPVTATPATPSCHPSKRTDTPPPPPPPIPRMIHVHIYHIPSARRGGPSQAPRPAGRSPRPSSFWP